MLGYTPPVQVHAGMHPRLHVDRMTYACEKSTTIIYTKTNSFAGDLNFIVK